jgi:hypothetical protein
MMIPIRDKRYFMGGVNSLILQATRVLTAEEYERIFPQIESSYPTLMSINMRDAMETFITNAPPSFNVTVDDVFDCSCFFYSDWDSIVAVTDEFIQAQGVEDVRRWLLQVDPDPEVAEARLQDLILMLDAALKNLISTIIGVLSRANAPAIIDYGCCYRLNSIRNDGTVVFQLSNPSVVYQDIEDDVIAIRAK